MSFCSFGGNKHDPEALQQAEQHYEKVVEQQQKLKENKKQKRIEKQKKVQEEHNKIQECKKHDTDERKISVQCWGGQMNQEQDSDKMETYLRKVLSYATNLSYYFSKYSMDVEYKYKYDNLSDYTINISTFKEDLFRIQSVIQVQETENNKSVCFKTFEEINDEMQDYIEAFSQLGIETIEPFLGFAGEINNLNNQKQKKGKVNFQQQDFRGIFLHGSKNDTLYCVWHGSCSEYDWKSNFDLLQTTPHKGYLDKMDERYNVHAGFGQAFNLTLSTKQEIQDKKSSNILTFNEKLYKLLENKKILYMSGHSLGAALATISSIYYKELFKKEKKNVRVKCWCYSAPRVFDKATCDIINEKLKKDNEYEDIIRQNVFMDPVTQSFESPLDFKKSIRLYFNLIGLVLNEPVYKGFKNYLDNSELLSTSITGSFFSLFSNDKSKVPQGFFDTLVVNHYVNKLKEAETISEMLLNLIDNSIGNSPIWIALDGIIDGKDIKEMLGNRIQEIVPDLDYEKCYFLKDMVRCLARLLDQDNFSEEKLENLMFQPLTVLEQENKEYYQNYVKQQQQNFLVKGIKNIGWSIGSWFRSQESLDNEEKQEKQDSFNFGFYLLRNTFENALENTKLYQVWDQILVEPTKASEFLWDYSDVGTCYLDVMKFENLVENKVFNTKKQQIYYSQIPEKFGKLSKYLVSYFSPLHYGFDTGEFKASLTFQHTVKELKKHGEIYQGKNGNAIIFEKCQAKNYELEKHDLVKNKDVILTKKTGECKNSKRFVDAIWKEFKEFFDLSQFKPSKSLKPLNKSLEELQKLKIQNHQNQGTLNKLLNLGISENNKVEDNIRLLGNFGRDHLITSESLK